jgi:hypothetical protein
LATGDAFEVRRSAAPRARRARARESWAKQPYHAAENLPKPDARKMVQRGIDAARTSRARAVRDAVTRLERDGHIVDACAVLMSPPMPDWSVGEILAVHFRMHKAEGVLFRDALGERRRHASDASSRSRRSSSTITPRKR